MKALPYSLWAAVFATCVAVPVLTWHHAEIHLRATRELLNEQTSVAAKLQAEDLRLSNTFSQIQEQTAVSESQVLELARLRHEAAQLRRLVAEANQLQRQINRTAAGLQDLGNEMQRAESPAALLADEIELRQARIAQLKSWLEDHPEENIPELQFLSGKFWIDSASHPRATDEELRQWMSQLRANAVGKFEMLAFKALQQYRLAHNGQFPAEMSELKPYFQPPLDDAILERYQVVPSKSLLPSLVEGLGDWVITQKAPVHKESDPRIAIGATNRRVCVNKEVWDPVP